MSVNQLDIMDRVLIHQKPAAFPSRSKYQVLTPDGRLLLRAKQGGWTSRSTYLEDGTGNQVIKMRIDPQCFGPTIMEVYLFGRQVASLRREFAWSTLIFTVLDAAEQPVLRIKGPVDTALFSYTRTYELQNLRKQRIGVIVKESRGFVKEALGNRDHFRLEFPQDLDVRYKVTAICACIFIDMGVSAFNPNSGQESINESQMVPRMPDNKVYTKRKDSDGVSYTLEASLSDTDENKGDKTEDTSFEISDNAGLHTDTDEVEGLKTEAISSPEIHEEAEVESDDHHRSPLALNADPYSDPQYITEMGVGDIADLFGPGKHTYVPPHYKDFARRFVFQYPYTDKKSSNIEYEAEEKFDKVIKDALKEAEEITDDPLMPKKAAPEVVLAVARQSAILQAAQPVNPADEVMMNDILRSGDYWNGVWKEDVKVPSKILRSHKKQLESVRVNIMPGSELHRLVSIMTKISPKLLYIINK